MKLLFKTLKSCTPEDTPIDEQALSIERDEIDNRAIVEVSLLPHDYYNAGVQDLGDLLRLTGYTVLQRASQVLSEARSVVVMTTLEDSCALVPMQHVAVQCSFDWHFHDAFRDEREGLPLHLKTADVVVIVWTAPHHPYNALGAWPAREGGARLIGITDAPESPVGGLARDVLIVPAPQRGLFKSHVAATLLVEMLVLMAAGRRGAREAPGAKGRATGGACAG